MSTSHTITKVSSSSGQNMLQVLQEIFTYRDLFRAFLERDMKLRYRQTFLGVLWVIMVPLLSAGILSTLLGNLGGFENAQMPKFVFFLLAQMPWTIFAQGISAGATSLESNAGLVSKVYFPRMIIPLAGVTSTIPDYLIGSIMVNIVAVIFGAWSPWLPLILVICLPIQLVFASGCGLFLASLNAIYRDVKYVVPVLIQTGFLLTVLVPIENYPSWAKFTAYLNPMMGIASLLRWTAGGTFPEVGLLLTNLVVCLVCIYCSIRLFMKIQQKMVDLL